MDDPGKRARETLRRTKLQNARRQRGETETTIFSSDEEYDAPPPEFWDQP